MFIRKVLLGYFVLALSGLNSQATKIVEIKPLTSTILMVHFDDGYVIHHKRGQTRSNESVIINKLDLLKAMIASSYSLQSADDANYLSSVFPLQVGRKSKPTEFAMLCQTYVDGCINTDADHALEHWIYLYLPAPLQTGKSYSLTLDNLATVGNVFPFTFNESALHSEAIHVNNIGYSTASPVKYAYLYHWMGDKGGLDLAKLSGKPFRLYNTDNSQFVFTGNVAFRKAKSNIETGQTTETPGGNFAAADVYECDFSTFNTPGNYKIVVEDIGSSFPFSISDDAYQEAFYWTMKGLYQNRSGIALTAPYAQFERPAPHNPQTTPGFLGKLKYSTFRSFDLSTHDGAESDKSKVEAGYKGILENTFGWYQDAGDWDGYYSHSHVPAYLLFLYESGRTKFTDGELNIPESGNSIPDVLDEAAWLLRYLKRAKDEVKQKGWGTGGVPGARVFGDLWGSDTKPGDVGQGSWEDTGRDWYVLGEDPWTSFKFAALAAQLAYILETNAQVDPQGVNWKQEATDAYAWAKANTKPADENRSDGSLRDSRLYAAASLFRLTGEQLYHGDCAKEISSTSTLDQGKQDQMFGIWMYLLAGNQIRESSVLANVKMLITAGADKYLAFSAESRAARWGGDFYFPMLVGQSTTPMVTPGVFGYLLNKDNAILATKYLTSLHTTADYYLGCNPLNMTWISGVGERNPVGIFHLDWWYFDKADANNSTPVIKGIVPYGPWRYDTSLGPLGWWNPNWAVSDKAGNPRIYPTSVDQWPGHERWFEMRVSPLSSEFTIHQNTVVAAFIYGFLTSGSATDIQEGIVTDVGDAHPDESSVHIFPNPTKDTAVISSTGVPIKLIELFDLNGKKILTIKGIDRKEYAVNLKDYESAAYLLRISLSSRKVVQRRLVLKK